MIRLSVELERENSGNEETSNKALLLLPSEQVIMSSKDPHSAQFRANHEWHGGGNDARTTEIPHGGLGKSELKPVNDLRVAAGRAKNAEIADNFKCAYGRLIVEVPPPEQSRAWGRMVRQLTDPHTLLDHRHRFLLLDL